MSLELYEHLKTAGVPSEPAHALAMLLVTKPDLVSLATKTDVTQLGAELRAEMHREFAAQTRAVITLLIALTAIYAGIVALLR